MLHRLLTHGSPLPHRPTHLLICWDGAKKKNDKRREPKPPEYYAALGMFQDAVTRLLGGAHVTCESEADDGVATAAVRSSAKPGHVAIVVSGDKDLHQLQLPMRRLVYCLNDKMILPASSICRRWGVKKPSQMSIALAIIGDRADLIPGMRKWGPAKVKELFKSVTATMSLEDALNAIVDQIPADRQVEFYENFDLTLLHPDLEGIPDPEPIKFATPEMVMAFSEKGGSAAEIAETFMPESTHAANVRHRRGNRSLEDFE